MILVSLLHHRIKQQVGSAMSQFSRPKSATLKLPRHLMVEIDDEPTEKR